MATLKKMMALEQEDIGEEQSNPSDNIGSSDFCDIVHSDFFVDKTLLIRDFVKSNYKCMMITAPCRFGKSINLSMLREFLQLKVNEYGDVIDNTATNKLFRTSKIYQDQDFITHHMGKHPVLYVSLKCGDAVDSYEDILNVLRRALHETYCRHKYLLQNVRLEDDDRDLVTEYCSPKRYTQISILMIRNGLKFLSQLLHRQFSRRVYVLVDEYDSIINRAIFGNSLELKQTTGILSEMLFSVLKNNNECLKKGLLTGVSRVASGALSWLSTIEHYTFLNSKFSKYYGITNQEIENIMDKYKVPEEDKKKVKEWYSGYEVPYSATQIFNIWSVINFLEKNRVRSYSTKTMAVNNIDELLNLPMLRYPIEELVMGHTEKVKHLSVVEISHTQLLKDIFCNTGDIKQPDVEMLMAFMLEMGYLTYLSTSAEKVKIPNKEIEAEFTNRLERFYQNLCGKAKFEDAVAAVNALSSAAEKSVFVNFTDALTILYEPFVLPEYKTITEVSLLSFLYILACNSKFESIKMHVLTENPNEKNLHLVLMDENLELVIIVNLKLKSDARKAYDEMGTKTIAKFFFQNYFGRKNKDTILIGLNISDSMFVSMAYTINNSEIMYANCD